MVKFLRNERDPDGRTMSIIRMGEHPNFEDLRVPWSELRVPEWPQSAPGGAAAHPKTVILEPPDESRMYNIT